MSVRDMRWSTNTFQVGREQYMSYNCRQSLGFIRPRDEVTAVILVLYSLFIGHRLIPYLYYLVAVTIEKRTY